MCKIYVLSFNSPLHRSLAGGERNHGIYENNAKSLLTIIIQLEGIRKEVYLCWAYKTLFPSDKITLFTSEEERITAM